LKLYDDAEIVFVNRDNYKEFSNQVDGNRCRRLRSLLKIQDSGYDHIVGNVRMNEMDLWVNYLNKTLNFETFIDFGLAIFLLNTLPSLKGC
jgi:4-hydroxyphenylpyruvate dioxygenase-like putative hemolysin